MDQGGSRRFTLGVVLVPVAGRGVILRLGETAQQVGRHICLGDFVAPSLFPVVFAGDQSALQQVDGGAGSDVTGFPEVGAAHGVRPRSQELLICCSSRVCAVFFFFMFRFSL